MCKGCKYNQGNTGPPRWVNHVYWIYLVLRGGMPADGKDLPLETRFDLGELREYLGAKRSGTQ